MPRGENVIRLPIVVCDLSSANMAQAASFLASSRSYFVMASLRPKIFLVSSLMFFRWS
jgi:hypothetical protein